MGDVGFGPECLFLILEEEALFDGVAVTGGYTSAAEIIADDGVGIDSTPDNNVPAEDDQESVMLSLASTEQLPKTGANTIAMPLLAFMSVAFGGGLLTAHACDQTDARNASNHLLPTTVTADVGRPTHDLPGERRTGVTAIEGNRSSEDQAVAIARQESALPHRRSTWSRR